MGFTTKCFIRKNTQELRDELERLGYDLCQCTRFGDAVWLDSYASGTIHGVGYYDDCFPFNSVGECIEFFLKDAEKDNLYDCGDNENLFLALCALRDDTDNHQLFTNGKDWARWEEYKNHDGTITSGLEFWYLASDIDCDKYHKASFEEIIEFFNK